MNLRAELAVNDVSVALNPFVEQYLARVVVGGVSCLRGGEGVQDLELYLEGSDVHLIVNGGELPLSAFPRDIITGTIMGLVSSLKGVGKADKVQIRVSGQ